MRPIFQKFVLIIILCSSMSLGVCHPKLPMEFLAASTSTENNDFGQKTPEILMDEFVAELCKLADDFPEFSGFSEYARKRKNSLELSYSQGLRDSRKLPGRIHRTFDSKGVYLSFLLLENLDTMSVTADMITHLPNLNFILFSELSFADDVSTDFKRSLYHTVEKYKSLFIKLDNESGNFIK